jgi:hypothetical protein
MAIYYSDHPSLSLATALYTSSLLTIKAPDAWYSDGTINRKQLGGLLQAVVTCDSCNPNPATSILTFSSYDGGNAPAAKFYFNLSEALALNDLTISSATIEAFEDTSCNQINPTATDVMAANAIITAGTNNANAEGFGFNCSNPFAPVSKYKKGNSFQVNGTTVNNGSVIVVNGCSISIVIDTSCSDLSCA